MQFCLCGYISAYLNRIFTNKRTEDSGLDVNSLLKRSNFTFHLQSILMFFLSVILWKPVTLHLASSPAPNDPEFLQIMMCAACSSFPTFLRDSRVSSVSYTPTPDQVARLIVPPFFFLSSRHQRYIFKTPKIHRNILNSIYAKTSSFFLSTAFDIICRYLTVYATTTKNIKYNDS